MKKVIPFIVIALACTCTVYAEPSLVGSWDCSGDDSHVLHDISPNKLDGVIHSASRVAADGVKSLHFSQRGSYVDFGNEAKLKPTGDFSFLIWMKLTPERFPNGSTNWHVFNWEKYKHSGVACRVDGSNGHLYIRLNQAGTFQHAFSNTALEKDTFYHVVIVKQKNRVTLYLDGKPDVVRSVKDPAPNDQPFTLGQPDQPFDGVMHGVQLYNRAITPSEIVSLYSQSATVHGKDVSWIGKLQLSPFYYPEIDRAIIETNYRGVLPLIAGERIVAELRQSNKPAVQMRESDSANDSSTQDFAFDLSQLQPGSYQVNVSVRSQDQVRAQATIHFQHPIVPTPLPSPADQLIAPLPAAPGPPAYTINVTPGGGFTVKLGERIYAVESAISYPNGNFNRLTTTPRINRDGEPKWKVKATKTANNTYRVIAQGRHYRITRDIVSETTRILITDHIENLTNDDLGVVLDNHIEAKGSNSIDIKAMAAPQPPVFIRAKDHGIGLVPLDDIYQLSQRTWINGPACGLKIAGLGIAKGASHTLQWAVYPIATTDYYDLINAIRKDEGINGLTIDGCLALTHAGRWLNELPPDELIRFGGIKYMSAGAVKNITDDPEISIEGIEFVRYPQQQETMRNNFAKIKKRFPDLQLMFHIAYNIYATNQPQNIFTDSPLIAQSGEHRMYDNGAGYFSEERRAQGWAWFPYIPTLSNSFGRELLRSVDVMMDDMGANGVWGDGLLTGYGPTGQRYPTSFVCTFDQWDGYSVKLHPSSHTITQKMGQKVALGREALLEYIRRINAKGGRVWINHMNTVPRTFAHVEAYWAAETNDGDYRCASLHLSPAPHGLANPDKFHTAQMIYDDVRSKLLFGALYSYYWWGGASQLTHPMITTEMFPITIEQIHSGCIKGRERIITMHAGVYGWADDHHLHAVRLFDARGRMTVDSSITTADKTGTRTQLNLLEHQTGIVIKLPVTIKTSKPTNVRVTRFDSNSLDLSLNGRGSAVLQLDDDQIGEIRVQGAKASINRQARTIGLTLDSPVNLHITWQPIK